MTSLWWEGRSPVGSDAFAEEVDDLVVGAGLTGVTTGLLLARAGRQVMVIDGRGAAQVATGNTTAKLTVLQGTRYSELLKRHPREVVQAYVDANLEGQQWLLRYCADHGVAVERRPAVTYAPDRGVGLDRAHAEHEAATQLGLPVRWVDDLPVPFPQAGGTVLADQAQIQPVDVVTRLAEDLRAEGGRLVAGVRLEGLDGTGPFTVRCSGGRRLRCRTVILATGVPVLDRTLAFATSVPERSYALAFEHADPPELMLLSAGGPTRSVRDARAADGSPRLLIGGEGHVVGRTRSELEHLRRLREWTAHSFPDATETQWWSAQDYRSAGGLPVVGRARFGGGNVYVATGFAKWGLTNGVAAALRLSTQVLGGSAPRAQRLDAASGPLSRGVEVGRINAGSAWSTVRRLVDAGRRAAPIQPPAEGAGVVGRRGQRFVATSTVGGRTCAVQGLCSHLGGVLTWNDAERSWDCPLHGSRFDPTGEVLEGPATRPLRRLTRPTP